MTRPVVVINVNGGVVQDVFASIPELQVLVVDWDAEASDNNPAQVELQLHGRTYSAAVIELPGLPLEGLAGSDVERAIDAACDQGILADDPPPHFNGESEPPWSALSKTTKSTRFVVYDADSDNLLTTEVFDSVEAAAEWNAQVADVLILPIRVSVCSA